MSDNVEDKISKSALTKGAKAVAAKAQTLQRLKVEYVEIDSVKPNAYNPNRQSQRDFELLLRSMREDGFTQPIVVQRATNEIVDGEHRWRGAREIGMLKVPCVFVDMTPEQMRISTLRHNRARGSEDVDLSSQLLRDLRELGALDWAQESLMLDDNELQRLVDDIPAPEALADEDYSTAWVPTRNVEQTGALVKDEAVSASMTPAAAIQRKEFSAKLEAAPTHDARLALELSGRKEAFRVLAIFKDEEAALVRSVLEPNPAAKLLALCRVRMPVPDAIPTVPEVTS
jgi:ParB-like chromosome segregation protein Spo0J